MMLVLLSKDMRSMLAMCLSGSVFWHSQLLNKNCGRRLNLTDLYKQRLTCSERQGALRICCTTEAHVCCLGKGDRSRNVM